ncbi:MAG: hypothetical protein IJA80_02400 [Clostridia bacterium]|nr:hypothetical protein [Clostridia bacterium]
MSKVTVVPADGKIIIENVPNEMIRSLLGNGTLTTLNKIEPGEVVKAGMFEIIVLEHLEEGTAIIFKNALEKRMQFDSKSGNWISSDLRNYLNTDFYKTLSMNFGAENIIEHTVDLTTVEGSKKYGSVQDKVSLLTCSLFSKYHDILEKYKLDKWWWLCTPIDVPGWEDCARAVYGIGILYYFSCYIDGGVRPFCILKSNIFVSKVEE